MATIKSRVLAELGQDNSSYIDDIANAELLFEDGIWEVANVVPHRLLLTESEVLVDPTALSFTAITDGDDIYDEAPSSPFNMGDDLLLLVNRVEADHTLNESGVITQENYLNKPCTKITYEHSHKAKDSASIYFATSNSPVYWFENSGGQRVVNVAPSATGYQSSSGSDANGNLNTIMPNGKSGLMVHKYVRQNLDTSTYATIESFDSIPEEVEYIIIKRIASKIVEQKMANMATQEEDSEIFQLLLGLKTQLETDINEAIKKLQSEWKGE